MQRLRDAVLSHILSCRTAIIASLNADRTPHTSYAPFVMEEETVYVLVSEAARHCGNLFERPDVSLLFIEDESRAEQIFARRRVSLECKAAGVSRDDPRFEALTGAMQERFGGIVPTLLSMSDFHLVAFTPHAGEAVFGFGDAYTIETPFERILPKRTGHR